MNQRGHYTFYALCIIVSLSKKIMSASPKKNIALTSGLALLYYKFVELYKGRLMTQKSG